MKTKLIEDAAEKTWAVIFDKDEECMAGLLAVAKQHRLAGSHFTAIGAFSAATLAFFDRARKEYKQIPLDEQVEVLTMVGDIALEDGEPKVHAHVVVGRSDGTTRGGHLIEARVWPTLELIVVESPKHLQRRLDQETGLALIDL